jgi:type II secretory pathway predicted ATPase ExeA
VFVCVHLWLLFQAEMRAVWLRYWGLSSDPFPERDSIYVPLPGHEEAVARLVHAVEAGHRLAVLAGPSGVGKTRVLRQALAQSRSPWRRMAMVSGPVDATSLFGDLADGLRLRPAHGGSDPWACWRALERAIQMCSVQGTQVVLAVDDGHTLVAAHGADALQRLGNLGGLTRGNVTVLLVDGSGDRQESLIDADWTLAVRLNPLTRTEAEAYLAARLAAAGGGDSPFTARAIARLHLLSGGIPRGLDWLASLCLMAGASRGLEAVSSELVDAVSCECRLPSRPPPPG